MLKKMKVAGSGKEACEIIIENPSDNKGSILVIESVKNINMKINAIP
jgi:hypothetical protein